MSLNGPDEKGSLVFKQPEMRMNRGTEAELIDYLVGLSKQAKQILRTSRSLHHYLNDWGSPDARLNEAVEETIKMLGKLNELCSELRLKEIQNNFSRR